MTSRVECAIDAFNRRDLPELLSFFACDAVLQEHPDFSPNPSTYEGRLRIGEYWESYDKAWVDPQIDVEELRSAGDRVIVFTRFTARGKTSGVPIETSVILVTTVTDGQRVSRIDFHTDREVALEAVGLSE